MPWAEVTLLWTALGLSAGLSPGPLLALLVVQTVRYGVREGIKVGIAPVLTDAPIVLVSLFLLSRLSRLELVMGVVSMCGAIYLAWLGIASLRTRAAEPVAASTTPGSIRKAFAVNVLNPHVYLFWVTVGGPLILNAAGNAPRTIPVMLACFYTCLVGSKIVLAVLIGRSREFLRGAAYTTVIRALGLVLLGFAVWILAQGIQFFR